MLKDYVFTSESVNEGHPDKVCDQISDAILDALLAAGPRQPRRLRDADQDRPRRRRRRDHQQGARWSSARSPKRVIRDIGYTTSGDRASTATAARWSIAVERQSPDISQGVTEGEGLFKEQGAGDQGMMFGYACDETKEFMPFAIYAAHRIGQQLAEARKSGELPFLLPDGKSQVSVEYKDGTPGAREDRRRLVAAHAPTSRTRRCREAIIEEVVKKVVPPEFLDKKTRLLHQPDRASSSSAVRRATAGSPAARSSSTPTAATAGTAAARSAARTRARSTAAPPTWRATSRRTSSRPSSRQRCEVQVAYAIGVADPVSVLVDTFGTGVVPDEKIARARARAVRPEARVAHPDARPEAADLPAHGVVRALRPRRRTATVLHLGAHRPGRRPARRRGPRPSQLIRRSRWGIFLG